MREKAKSANGQVETGMQERETTLGQFIRQGRQLKGLSLARTAEAADISAAYQKKLEADEVKQPSPHILRAEAEALDLEYVALMQLAGYIVPGEAPRNIASEFDHALSSADLTDDERRAVAAYIALLRQQRQTK
jgi:transcriptional regulator with XRE-family HTH domain